MEDTANEGGLEITEPRIRFYNRPVFRTAALIGVVLLLMFLIGLVFDSTYFRF